MLPAPSGSEASVPQLVVRLIHAATKARNEDADISDVAGALHKFASLALWVIPNHGVFVANHRDVATSVSKIATDHLRFGEAQRDLYEALERIASDEQRDSIESAVGQLRVVSDAAYFYAGLVFGLTMFDAAHTGDSARPGTTSGQRPKTSSFASDRPC